MIYETYPTRYQAKKHATGADVVVKVDGGYAVMDAVYYQTWRRQK